MAGCHPMLQGALPTPRGMFPPGSVETNTFRSLPKSALQNPPQVGDDPYRVTSDPIRRMGAASAWKTTTSTAPQRGEIPLQTRATHAVPTVAPLCPSPPFGFDTTSNWAPRRRAKSRHVRRSRRRAPSLHSAILAWDESDVAKSTKQLLPPHKEKEPSRAKSFRTALGKSAEPTPTVSPQRRSEVVPKHQDTWDATQPRRMRFFLQKPRNNRKTHEAGSPRDLTIHEPHLDATPQIGHTETSEPSDEVTTIFDLHQSLGSSTKPTSSVDVFPPCAAPDTKCIAHDTAGLSDEPGHTMRPQAPEPPGDSMPELRTSSDTSWKTSNLRQPQAEGFMESISSPVSILRRYFTRVNDGSWTWHSKSETSATISESSDRSEVSNRGAAESRWAAHTACLVLCLASAALLSFWGFYAIADAAFAGRELPEETGDPMTVMPPDEKVSSTSPNSGRYQRDSHRKVLNSPLEKGVLVPSPEGLVRNKAPDEDGKAATLAD